MLDNVSGSKILIVDDIPVNIDLLVESLNDDYEIFAALDGLSALKIIREEKLDLILLDVQMPEVSGFDVCGIIKHNEEFCLNHDTPVIFLTAMDDIEDKKTGFELGAVDYITKPFNIHEVKVRIKNHLKLKYAREKLSILSSKLGKYISPQLYKSIFKGEKDVRIDVTSKPLTVCFTDIVGFTKRVESMKARKLVLWLNTYLNNMAEIAIRHGGTIDKFIGDSVMVFYGDPKSEGIKSDAIRCINMAKSMLKEAKNEDITIRIGINTGDCIVGNFGSINKMEYSIIGNAVNIASRLETNSNPGKILISESTYNLIKDKIPCTFRGNIFVKGISKAVSTYWVD